MKFQRFGDFVVVVACQSLLSIIAFLAGGGMDDHITPGTVL